MVLRKSSGFCIKLLCLYKKNFFSAKFFLESMQYTSGDSSFRLRNAQAFESFYQELYQLTASNDASAIRDDRRPATRCE